MNVGPQLLCVSRIRAGGVIVLNPVVGVASAEQGNRGYFYMPDQYLTGSKLSVDSSPINHAHLASDFWAIQAVSS